MTEREKFEKWHLDYYKIKPEMLNGIYQNAIFETRWITWQARAEAVCPYIVTGTPDDVGGVGTSYCSLAEAKRPEVGWQPIETAPRDGTHFMGCRFVKGEKDFNGFPPHVVHYWAKKSEEGFYLSSGALDWPIKDFTHWMPLPPPPAAPARIKSKDGGGE